MKNLKILPKMFVQTFAVLAVLVIAIHLLVYFIFPPTYLELRSQAIRARANEIARSIQAKPLELVEQSLNFYSKNSDIKVAIKGRDKANELPIGDNVAVDLASNNNSLIIEEREISLNTGEKITLQFVSTADMQKDAKDLSLGFLPYSLMISLLFSLVVSFVYARAITGNIREIEKVVGKMTKLDRQARLKVDSTNEVGQLKAHINDLYATLLNSIDDLEVKNQEIVRLEKLKYNFFRGRSHELKTPLASLKIILENMKYKIGKYKNRDAYIDNCLEIVDDLARNISQTLSVSSLEQLKNDQELLQINDILPAVLKQYELLASRKCLTINNYLTDEKLYIGKPALKIVLSNLISNAVKYSDEGGVINIGAQDGWFYVENSYEKARVLDLSKMFAVNFDLSKKDSSGLGLYIVKNILQNYGIKYQAITSQIGVKVSLKLASSLSKPVHTNNPN